MKMPKWFRPAFWGAVIGALALVIIGFAWAGWMTSGRAERMAAERARAEVVSALVPVCLERFQRDPQAEERIAQLRGAQAYQRRDLVMNFGWATLPGTDRPDRAVAEACVSRITTQF